MGFIRYTIRRLLMLVPVALGASAIIFTIMRLVPGDPALAWLGGAGVWAKPEDIAEIRRAWHLDEPIPIQYLNWLWRVMQWDFGRSLFTGARIGVSILSRLPVSLELATVSLLIALSSGVVTGILSAVKRGSILDHMSRAFAVVFYSVPGWWIGILMVFALGVYLRILPPGGYVDLFKDPLENLKYIIMPSIAIATQTAAVFTRMTRSFMLEIVSHDYIRTARAKGLQERIVIYKHALRNAMIPIVTLVGLSVAGLIGGAIVTETVFGWPGLGTLLYDSILTRDYPVIQGATLLITVIFVLLNLFVDLLYAYIDPRVRYE